ncbi:hypothetical protein ALC53_00005, partial [Atta colombica]
ILKPSAQYNRRAAIIEGLRAGRSAMEIIRFFEYPRSTVYDVIAKYIALEQSNEGSSMSARKSHSKKRTARGSNKSRHPNMTSLRTVVEATFVGMNSVTLQRACEHFRPSIEAVIQANGGYIE